MNSNRESGRSRSNRYVGLVILISCVSAFFAAGCNAPPVGLYDVRAYESIPYVSRGERKLMMDIYTPVGGPMPRPAIVLFHGGGWMYGDRRDLRPMVKHLASMGYTAATAQYRLSNDGGEHPAPVLDALAAIRFLRFSRAQYGIDPQRVGVGGFSAGAQLALVAGLAGKSESFKDEAYAGESADVRCIVSIAGPTDITSIYKSSNWMIRRLGEAYLGGPPEKVAARYVEASPISHVHAGAPPILILHGDQDEVVPFEQATKFAEACEGAGVSCTVAKLPSFRHAWCLPFGGQPSLRAWPIMTHFLAKHLEAGATGG
ncbi:Carboxylesterase NlhH [Phycisphaerae bacterium RAS2]|nr:Carboxylesterase NlhH [Phycisphaerae bacterium RAS2]